MADYPENVQGFKVMRLKFSESSKGVHHILWKRHNVRVYSEQKPPERTLFVVNLPPYCNENNLRPLFQEFGDIDNIYFSKKPSSGASAILKYPHFSPVEPVEGIKVAYIVFAKEVSVKRALAAPASKVLVLSTSDHRVVTGIEKWKLEYNQQYVNPEELSEEIKLVIGDYEDQKEESKRAAEEEEGEPDDDGWITVKSSKKKKPKLLKVDELKKPLKKKKQKQQELVKFYTFQQRETKINNLAQLRKKFEEDKKRINMMKGSRKFRP